MFLLKYIKRNKNSLLSLVTFGIARIIGFRRNLMRNVWVHTEISHVWLHTSVSAIVEIISETPEETHENIGVLLFVQSYNIEYWKLIRIEIENRKQSLNLKKAHNETLTSVGTWHMDHSSTFLIIGLDECIYKRHIIKMTDLNMNVSFLSALPITVSLTLQILTLYFKWVIFKALYTDPNTVDTNTVNYTALKT